MAVFLRYWSPDVEDYTECQIPRSYQYEIRLVSYCVILKMPLIIISNKMLGISGEHVRLPLIAEDVENRFHNCVRE